MSAPKKLSDLFDTLLSDCSTGGIEPYFGQFDKFVKTNRLDDLYAELIQIAKSPKHEKMDIRKFLERIRLLLFEFGKYHNCSVIDDPSPKGNNDVWDILPVLETTDDEGLTLEWQSIILIAGKAKKNFSSLRKEDFDYLNELHRRYK